MNEEPFDASATQTRGSLLLRLHNWADAEGWREFDRLYRGLVYRYARRTGLSHADAEDVAQDVLRRVAETIHTFEADPQRGSFRSWLMNLTRWRAMNKRSRQPPEIQRAAHRPPGEEDRTTSTTALLPDQAQLEQVWDVEWQTHLLDAACARLARRVAAKHYQVFELYVRRQQPVLQVARELRINPASIYLIGHRLTKQLKREVEALRAELG